MNEVVQELRITMTWKTIYHYIITVNLMVWRSRQPHICPMHPISSHEKFTWLITNYRHAHQIYIQYKNIFSCVNIVVMTHQLSYGLLKM
jgi:hypothetical protein